MRWARRMAEARFWVRLIGLGGEQIGAVAGYSWAGMAEIKQLWVDEDNRGRGLWRALLEVFVAEADARGCQSVWVMSYDFQAPGSTSNAGSNASPN